MVQLLSLEDQLTYVVRLKGSSGRRQSIRLLNILLGRGIAESLSSNIRIRKSPAIALKQPNFPKEMKK
uniref:Uncharacterized protein n=1 Tax=Glossina austeni TaxID=7395 RepID=A0A1A9UKQ0_GLOAU